MAALSVTQTPLMIRMPSGQIVPANGGALLRAGYEPPIAGATLDDSGALDQPLIDDPTQDAGALAARPGRQKIAKAKGRFSGKAGAGLGPSPLPSGGFATPQQPAVMYGDDGGSMSAMDILKLAKGLGSAMGGAGGLKAPDVAGDVPPINPNDPSFRPPGPIVDSWGFDQNGDVLPQSASSGDGTGGAGGGFRGLLTHMKDFLGISDTPKVPGNPDAPAPSIDMTKGQDGRYALRAPEINPELGALASVDAPVPSARPAFDRLDSSQPAVPRRDLGAPDIANNIDYGGPLSAAAPHVPPPEPSYFDKLRHDPLRMALLMGGLSTMASASRPGATPLGALGEGLMAGAQGSMSQEMAERKAELEARKVASEEQLQRDQGEWYRGRGEAQGALADAAQTRAGAAVTNAETNKGYRGALGSAALTRAGAAQTNAETNKGYRGALGAAATKNADSRSRSADASGKTADAAMIRAQNGGGGANTGFTNAAKRSALITSRTRALLGGYVMPTPGQIKSAQDQATREVDTDLSRAGEYAPRQGGALAATGPSRQSGGALAVPQPGAVVNGYAFQGGDPHDRNNWSRVN